MTEKIFVGQLCLIACCLFYLAWWNAAYYPGADGNTLNGSKGVWFWLTAATALIGIWQNAQGIHNLPEVEAFSVRRICLVGAMLYFVLAVVTYGIFRRPLTAELALIVAWCGLETATLQALWANGSLTSEKLYFLAAVVLLATVIGLIAYIEYYKLSETKAFYCGMIPLAVDAAAMGIVCYSIS